MRQHCYKHRNVKSMKVDFLHERLHFLWGVSLLCWHLVKLFVREDLCLNKADNNGMIIMKIPSFLMKKTRRKLTASIQGKQSNENSLFFRCACPGCQYWWTHCSHKTGPHSQLVCPANGWQGEPASGLCLWPWPWQPCQASPLHQPFCWGSYLRQRCCQRPFFPCRHNDHILIIIAIICVSFSFGHSWGSSWNQTTVIFGNAYDVSVSWWEFCRCCCSCGWNWSFVQFVVLCLGLLLTDACVSMTPLLKIREKQDRELLSYGYLSAFSWIFFQLVWVLNHHHCLL